MSAKESTVTEISRERVRLRYERELLAIQNCPGVPAPFKGTVYRVAHKELRRSFDPTAVSDPGRLKRSSSTETHCSLWGLSMFESLEQLCKMVKRVEKTNKNFRILVGDHYVELELTSKDGQRTAANKGGHFDLHPADSFDPNDSLRCHKELPP